LTAHVVVLIRRHSPNGTSSGFRAPHYTRPMIEPRVAGELSA
jgi:hypothetical protein